MIFKVLLEQLIVIDPLATIKALTTSSATQNVCPKVVH
jgi:hypothetical protein